jgi:bifunctional DNA-binding transcriptional regulator/antitoxin component of YhaV-PrlF toxin-antitoxin module
MERGLIRRRWQVTIPAEVRRELNLFMGQAVNWEVDHERGVITIFTGSGVFPGVEMAAFQDAMTRKLRHERGQKCGRKIRKSAKKEKKLRELVDRSRAWRERSSGATELQEVLSQVSQYLLGVQERLRQRLEGSTEQE